MAYDKITGRTLTKQTTKKNASIFAAKRDGHLMKGKRKPKKP